MSDEIPTDMTSAISKLRELFSSPNLQHLDTVSRERLEELVGRLQQGQDEAIAVLRTTNDTWQQRAAALEAQADAAQARLAAAQEAEKARVAKAKTPPPPQPPAPPTKAPPKPPEQRLDPETGAALRHRLLSRFGGHLPPPWDEGNSDIDDRADWKDWLEN